jgi:hypothetical protein
MSASEAERQRWLINLIMINHDYIVVAHQEGLPRGGPRFERACAARADRQLTIASPAEGPRVSIRS